jgi:hypothetical protein
MNRKRVIQFCKENNVNTDSIYWIPRSKFSLFTFVKNQPIGEYFVNSEHNFKFLVYPQKVKVYKDLSLFLTLQ